MADDDFFNNFNPTLCLGETPPNTAVGFEGIPDNSSHHRNPGSNALCGADTDEFPNAYLAQEIARQLEDCFNSRNAIQISCSSSAYNSCAPSPDPYTNPILEPLHGNLAESSPTNVSYAVGNQGFSANQPASAAGPVELTSITEDMMNYPGSYGFDVAVGDSGQSKGLYAWYGDRRKLFVKPMSVIPFTVTARVAHDNTWNEQPRFLRIIPKYKDASHEGLPVVRCMDHCKESDTTNVGVDPSEIPHFVRMVSNVHKVSYEDEYCPGDKRLNAKMELPKFKAGCAYSVLIHLKFMCYHSCKGSSSRQPMCLLFLLENMNGECIGRCMMELRACASPKRDYHNEVTKHQQTAKRPRYITTSTSEVTTEAESDRGGANGRANCASGSGASASRARASYVSFDPDFPETVWFHQARLPPSLSQFAPRRAAHIFKKVTRFMNPPKRPREDDSD